MSRPSISVTLHTASRDNFLASKGIPSAAAMVVDCLNRQTLKSIELVYVDFHHAANASLMERLHASFPVKHVPVHPEHRYWLDNGHYFIPGAKNTGILYADGELIVSIDDGAIIETDLLEKYWTYYKQEGRYLQSLYRKHSEIRTENGLPVYPIAGERAIGSQHDDTRASCFPGDALRHEFGEWCYAGSSFALEHVLRVNGVNDRMGGQKSLEDCDLGVRLQQTGGKFVTDKSAWLGYIEHPSYSGANRQTELCAIENLAMINIARELGTNVANLPNQIGPRELDIIRKTTLEYRKFDPSSAERSSAFEMWMNVPSFDLKKQRQELRDSSNWKWQTNMEHMTFSEMISAWAEVDIAGWCDETKARNLIQIITLTRPKTVVEIGVFGGKSLIPQALALRETGGVIRGIDPWDAQEAIVGMKERASIDWWSKLDMEGIRLALCNHIRRLRLDNQVDLIRETSERAASRFENESIGLLHIDGNHSVERSIPDAQLYLPKVAPGGFIYVDDIGWVEGGEKTVEPALDYLLANGCTLLDRSNNDAVLRKGR